MVVVPLFYSSFYKTSLRSRPARLSLESSIEESHDSHVTGGGAGGVADRRQEKRSSFLPEVVRTVRTPPCESETHVSKSDSQATCTFITSLPPSLPPSAPLVTTQRHSNGSTSERLPSLGHMRPVAMVAVDTEKEKLRVQQFGSKRKQRSKGKVLMQRSQSLMSVRYALKEIEL